MTELQNAFNETLVFEILAASKQLGKNEKVQVFLLSARGKRFSAGGELNWMGRMAQNSHQAVTANKHLISPYSQNSINHEVIDDAAQRLANT